MIPLPPLSPPVPQLSCSVDNDVAAPPLPELNPPPINRSLTQIAAQAIDNISYALQVFQDEKESLDSQARKALLKKVNKLSQQMNHTFSFLEQKSRLSPKELASLFLSDSADKELLPEKSLSSNLQPFTKPVAQPVSPKNCLGEISLGDKTDLICLSVEQMKSFFIISEGYIEVIEAPFINDESCVAYLKQLLDSESRLKVRCINLSYTKQLTLDILPKLFILFPNSCQKTLATTRHLPSFHDVFLLIGEEKIGAYSELLKIHSAYFRHLFRQNCQERKEGKIDLTDSSFLADSVSLYVDFIYYGSLKWQALSLKGFIELAEVSDYFADEKSRDFILQHFMVRIETTLAKSIVDSDRVEEICALYPYLEQESRLNPEQIHQLLLQLKKCFTEYIERGEKEFASSPASDEEP